MELSTCDSSVLTFKKNFEEKLRDYEIHHQGSFRKPWTNERILEVISNVKNARVSMTNTECRTSMSYYWLSKYDFMTTDNEEYLIFKKKNPEDPVIRIIAREEYFDILNTVHEDCGHGGRDKLVYSLKGLRYYVAKKAIEIFVSLCPACNTKRNILRKGTIQKVVTRPIVSQDFNIRGQVDLIDFQFCPDGEYKWLLHYEDDGTKFLNLRPLKTDMASEVSMELIKIFLNFGAPSFLQSYNGQEFTAKVIEELVALWPDCRIVQCQSQPQTQSIESRRDVENTIRSWMKENNSTNWSVGCYFCQYQKNASFHRIIGKSPYKALFGTDPKIGFCGIDTQTQLLNVKTEELMNTQVIKAEPPQIEDEPCDIDVPHQSLSTDSNANAKIVADEKKYIIFETDSISSYVGQNDEAQIAKALHKQHESPCKNSVQDISGLSEGGERFDFKVMSFKCKMEKDIQTNEAHNSLKRAADKMIENTPKKLPTLGIGLGHSVWISVPKVDRGPFDIKTIKGKIVDFSNGVYRVGTKSGTIKNWFVQKDLQPLMESYDDEISITPISLRDAVSNESKFSEQGFQNCSCKPAQKQCCTMRCACFKKKVFCSLKCHKSLSCVNIYI